MVGPPLHEAEEILSVRCHSLRESPMAMERAIFQLKASVEATSLYLLVCALMDEGIPATLQNIRVRWTESEEALSAAAEELVQRGVLASFPKDEKTPVTLEPVESWEWNT